MSNSFVAGQRLAASRIPGQRLWTVSSTSATAAIGATETVVITSPSSTYVAGGAYTLKFHGMLRPSAATAASAGIQIRDTNASGTVRMLIRQFATPAVVANYDAYFEWTVANTTGSDITGRVLVLTLTGTAAPTYQINAGSPNAPYYLACEYSGLQTDFSEAVAL
ncbi:MAG TPA: hypothetical protein VLT90_12940 [Terriglobales bacterium]|nr:hypothetical protein [Terriglobales bacterium]